MITLEEQAHRKWMEALLNTLPSAVIVVELDTARILYANATALKYVVPEVEPAGIEENAEAFRLYEARWRGGLFENDGSQIAERDYPSRRVARGETFTAYEINWTCAETGNKRTFLCQGALLPPAHGKDGKGIVSFVDITELSQYREQLKQAISIREDFISVAAHELKTPISSILLTSQNLVQKLTKEELSRAEILRRLGAVERSGQKLNALVRDLLEVSRRSSPTQVTFQDADVCEVIRETVLRNDDLAKRQGIEIRLDLPKVRIRGTWDVSKVEQIMTNLVNNAMKYGCGKPVDINVAHVDGWVVVDVRDYGIGVPEKDRKRIFQRFERAVSGDQYAGMGIGLWLAGEAAKSLGGRIEIHDPPNGPGSVFRLCLPMSGVLEER